MRERGFSFKEKENFPFIVFHFSFAISHLPLVARAVNQAEKVGSVLVCASHSF